MKNGGGFEGKKKIKELVLSGVRKKFNIWHGTAFTVRLLVGGDNFSLERKLT